MKDNDDIGYADIAYGTPEDESRQLTDKQERYAQLRAQGFTKAKSASIAFNDPKYASSVGYEAETKPHVKKRIQELKDDRAATFGLTPEEQIRKYHDIFQEAMGRGQLSVALKAMERLDSIGGFEIRRTESTRITRTADDLKDEENDVKKDLEKFSSILGAHGKRPSYQTNSDKSSTVVPIK